MAAGVRKSVTVGLNVTREELDHPGFAQKIMQKIRRYPVLRENLELELFEQVLVDRQSAV